MVSAATLHVVSTELAVGSFAVAGVAFLMAGLASHGWFFGDRHLSLGRQRGAFCAGFWAGGHAVHHHHRHSIQSR